MPLLHLAGLRGSLGEPKFATSATPLPARVSWQRKKLDYPTALGQGWPIATGVIEGAEAALKLRALRQNGDFEA
jgi:hypothetical protein